MIRLVETGWADEFASAVEQFGDELRIVCPFIKLRTIESLLKKQPRTIQVITRFNLSDCINGVSDIGALKRLVAAGGSVRGVMNLHAKVYLFGANRSIVTSANLTNAALHSNHEFGIVSDDPDMHASCRSYFDNLWSRCGPDVTMAKLDAWEATVAERLARIGSSGFAADGAGDFGVDVGLEATPSVRTPVSVLEAQQAFVKFLGESHTRVPLHDSVLLEIERAGCHNVLAYPEYQRPRAVKDGAVMFIARLTRDPDDITVFGRAIGMAHVEGRDDATPEDIERRNFRGHWSRYIRVHHSEFVAGTFANGVSLYKLIDELGPNVFQGTKTNLASGVGNTDPKASYSQKPAKELSSEGFELLNRRLQEAFERYGIVPQAEIDLIERRVAVKGVVRDLGKPYADGVPRLEIHVPAESAVGLPHRLETRQEIRLTVAGVQFEGGIRATKLNGYVWICPDLKNQEGTPTNLGQILTEAGFQKNDRVLLLADGNSIEVSRPQ